LIIAYGGKKENIFVCDTKGVIYPGRAEGMNKFKETLANPTISQNTSLAEICKGADVLIGVSSPKIFTEEICKSLNENPVIFAMANPEPEVRPELAKEWRPDCIIATGRSDYPNQINNVMCFPFLFRATLDTRSKQINEEMKMAAAKALAALAKEPVPQQVKDAIPGRDFTFGRDYVIPTPFDPRLITHLPVAVAKAAIESGSASHKITDFEAYAKELAARVNQ
jgi:malate dehydrogenase (oxaloacetate-decarboxylating)(NADP+)